MAGASAAKGLPVENWIKWKQLVGKSENENGWGTIHSTVVLMSFPTCQKSYPTQKIGDGSAQNTSTSRYYSLGFWWM